MQETEVKVQELAVEESTEAAAEVFDTELESSTASGVGEDTADAVMQSLAEGSAIDSSAPMAPIERAEAESSEPQESQSEDPSAQNTSLSEQNTETDTGSLVEQVFDAASRLGEQAKAFFGLISKENETEDKPSIFERFRNWCSGLWEDVSGWFRKEPQTKDQGSVPLQQEGPRQQPALDLASMTLEAQELQAEELIEDGPDYEVLLKLGQKANEAGKRLHEIMSDFADDVRREKEEQEKAEESAELQEDRSNIVEQIKEEVAVDPKLAEVAEAVAHSLTSDPNYLPSLTEPEITDWLERQYELLNREKAA